MKETTKSKIDVRDNCLNLIRIVAALQVLFGHVLEHLELPLNDTLFRISCFFRGVPIFFVISGFLIWNSIKRSNTYGQYLKKRFWRIYPELWIAIAVEMIVLVVLYHGWDYKNLILFALGQGTIFQFWTPDCLRGYGVGTPNGALWTIGVMIQFYIIAWFFQKMMKNKGVFFWMTCFALSFGVSIGLDSIVHKIIGSEIVKKLYDQSILKYFWLFLFGMLISRFRDELLPVLKKYWCFLLGIAAFFFWTKFDIISGYFLLWSVFLSAGLIGFAYQFPKLNVSPDVSYGLFLYHMTIVNVFVHFGLIRNWIYVIPVVCISILFAYVSTISVGAYASKRKQIMWQYMEEPHSSGHYKKPGRIQKKKR